MEGFFSSPPGFYQCYKNRLKVLADRPFPLTAVVAPQVARTNGTASSDLSVTFSFLIPMTH